MPNLCETDIRRVLGIRVLYVPAPAESLARAPWTPVACHPYVSAMLLDLLPAQTPLAAYLAFCAAIVAWNVAAAGRIVHDHRAPVPFVLATGLGALLLVPALLVAVSAASVTYGRAIQPVTWVWPVVTLIFAIQATIALARRLVYPLFGVPVFLYNLIIATVALGQYLPTLGVASPPLALVLSAARTQTLGLVGGQDVLWQPAWLLIPLFAPALPSRSRVKRWIRTALASAVTVATALVLIAVPHAIDTIRSYERFSSAPLQERPRGDLAFGVRVFPDLRTPPPGVAIARDLPLVDSLGAEAISVVVAPEAVRLKTLDSLAHTLDAVRGDSTIIIVTLGYPRDAAAQYRRSPSAYVEQRARDVDRLARALKPTIIVPAHEPYGAGERALGTLPPDFWRDYIVRSARAAHAVNPNIKVGLAAASFGPRDSTLYTWAAGRGSPVDLLGFSLMPGFDGGKSIDTHLRIAQRWMRSLPTIKPHWIWAAGGFPVAHGERSQRLAMQGVVSWATTHPVIAGVVVATAGDYDTQTGLRAPNGRIRPAFGAVYQAAMTLRDTNTR